MKKAFFTGQFVFLLYLGMIVLPGCNSSSCKNTNPIFENQSPESEMYKAELAHQLRLVNKTKLTYWFNGYKERDGIPSLWFVVKGDGLCATLILEADQDGKMGPLIRKKGVSYRGAEFVDLQFDIRQQNGKTGFVFRDYRMVID